MNLLPGLSLIFHCFPFIDVSTGGNTKPVLMRQDCTATYVLSASAGLGLGGSEESATGGGPTTPGVPSLEESGARSVPDIELHCREDDVHRPALLLSTSSGSHNISSGCRHRGGSVGGCYQLLPPYMVSSYRRASTAPMSPSLHMARLVFKLCTC